MRDGRIRAGQHVLLRASAAASPGARCCCAGSGIDEEIRFRVSGAGLAGGRHDAGLSPDSPAVRAMFAEASDVARRGLRGSCVDEGPAEALNPTVNTQPVMLTAGYAVYRAWRDAGRADAGDRRRTQPRRIHRARRRRRDRVQRRAAAGALSRAGDAGSGADGHGRDGGDPGARRRRGARGLRARRRRRGRRGGQFQRARARWSSRATRPRSSARRQPRKARGREARGACCR